MKLSGVVLSVMAAFSPVVGAQEAAPTRSTSFYAQLSHPYDTGTVLSAARRLNLNIVEVSIPGDTRFNAMIGFTVPRHLFGQFILDTLNRLPKSPELRKDASDTLAVMHAELDVSVPVESVDSAMVVLLRSWGLDSLRVSRAWAGATGQGVKVAIVDTGYDLTHPEFAGRVIACRTFVQGEWAGREGCAQPMSSCNWHGQHVAGTVGGSTAGVAPASSLILLANYEDVSGQCRNWASTRAAALQWLAINHPDVAAVNFSTGGTGMFGSEMLAVNALYDMGITVVGASGNDAAYYAYYPGKYDKALSVGSVNQNFTRSSFSNRDTLALGFVAPGANITSAIGAAGYGSKSGTSMAAPHITAAIVLLRQALPDAPIDSLWAILRTCAKELGTPGHDPSYGHGFPRLDCAVALAQGKSLQPTSTAGTLAFSGTGTQCAPVDSPVEWTLSSAPGLTITREANRVCVTNTDPTPRTVALSLSGVP